jgi:hypothetical protein
MGLQLKQFNWKRLKVGGGGAIFKTSQFENIFVSNADFPLGLLLRADIGSNTDISEV